MLKMRLILNFDKLFAGFLIRKPLADFARALKAYGLVDCLSPRLSRCFSRLLPVRHRAFFYGSAQSLRSVERIPSVRPGSFFVRGFSLWRV